MTDGNACISDVLFNKILALIRQVRPDFKHKRPDYIQARIGGSKGIWARTPNRVPNLEVIYIRPSQIKFQGSEEEDVCVEVNFQGRKQVARGFLDRQTMQVLVRRGVPVDVLTRDVESYLENISRELFSQSDPKKLQGFLQKQFNVDYCRMIRRFKGP